MKILKRILSILLIFIALLTISTFFTPKSLQVEESIVMAASPKIIYNEVLDFKGWTNWSVWHQIDSNMVSSFSDSMGIIGSFTSWKSDHPKVGDGKQTIVELKENNFIKLQLEFGRDTQINHSEWIFTPQDDNTTLVKWTFDGAELPFYMRLISHLFIDGMIHDSYVIGLSQLKNVVESKPQIIEIPENISIIEVEAEMTLTILDSTDANGVTNRLAELYKDIMVFAAIQGMNQSGAPLAYFHYYSPEKVIFEAAIPVEGNLIEDGRIKLKEKKAGKTLKGNFFGNSDQSGEMHEIMEKYLQETSTELSGSPYEIYITDPAMEADTTKWRTEIYYPIQ